VREYIDVLDPTAKTTVRQEKIASGLADLNGKAIGLVDNRKPNFDIFLEKVEKVLCQRFQFSDIVRLKKGGTGATVPLTSEEIEQLVPKCDAIICGVCD
jgi:hypothetical protein